MLIVLLCGALGTYYYSRLAMHGGRPSRYKKKQQLAKNQEVKPDLERLLTAAGRKTRTGGITL